MAGIDAVAHPARVRGVIGLAGQYAAVEEAMTGRENLVMVARLFGHGRRQAAAAATQVLGQLGLTDAGDRLVRTYSGGMRRRLDLGASLVGAPQLLLLDEPTTGLDPASRIELWDAIRELVAGGTDVLLTTQYLEEADQLADHVVIIDHGRSIATGTPSELKSQAGRDMIEVRVRDHADVAAARRALRPARHRRRRGSTSPTGGSPSRSSDGTARLADAVRRLADEGIALDDVGLRRPTLDEVFLALTGRPPAAPSERRRARRRLTRPRHHRLEGARHDRPRPHHRRPPSPQPPRRSPATAVARPAGSASAATTVAAVAGRTLKQFVRTPQLIVVGALTSVMFLLIFRYVFGGAIATGPVSYVDFLIPGLAAAGAMFSGAGGAVGVADRRRERVVRPPPLAADPALGGADRSLGRRHRARRLGGVRHRRRRLRSPGSASTVGASTRSSPSCCASSSAPPSRGRSSTWASSAATPRRPRACRCWSSRSCSCPAPTCRSSRCPGGCSRSPSTSR